MYLTFQLAELQRKVRSNVRSEYMLSLNCGHPEKQLFDWGMMRLSRPSYGVGDAFGVDSDNHLKKKRDAEAIFYLLLCFFIRYTFDTTNMFSSTYPSINSLSLIT